MIIVSTTRFGGRCDLARTRSLILAVAFWSAAGASAAFAGGSAKFQMCHIPPGDAANAHTITVSQDALRAHIAHGDVPEGCQDYCSRLCNDGNPCTIDACLPGTLLCLPDHPPVDCDDGLACTEDRCDPASGGCLNLPACADSSLCTVDFCSPRNGGECVHAPKECGGAEVCNQSTGNCLDPCAGVICLPLDQCHVAGVCVAGICDDPVAPDGASCNDGNCMTEEDQCLAGTCSGTASAPVDSDGDGLPDTCDPCPFDFYNDLDGDGVCDSADLCPSDPDKTEPGICDCNNPDWDSDGDGVLDCLDRCPMDNPDDANGDGCCDSAICEGPGGD